MSSVFRACALAGLALATARVAAEPSAANVAAGAATHVVHGQGMTLHILVQKPGLSLYVGRVGGGGQFRQCDLTLGLDGRMLDVEPAGPCSFTVSGLSAGEHRLRADVVADGGRERLEATLRLPQPETAATATATAPRWGIFAGLLGFVVAVLLGSLLALKRSE